MTMKGFKKLCELATLNPLAARVKAYQTLPPEFIQKLKSVAKWSDEYITSWDRLQASLQIKCPWGTFWLVPSPSAHAIQSADEPKLDPRDLRTLAQTLHPPF